jgi:hypothetical protein
VVCKRVLPLSLHLALLHFSYATHPLVSKREMTFLGSQHWGEAPGVDGLCRGPAPLGSSLP